MWPVDTLSPTGERCAVLISVKKMSSVGINRNVLRQVLRMGVKELCERELRKKRRTLWIRKWINRREELGASNTLLRELAAEDVSEYFKFMRMNSLKFEELLELVMPFITKADTVMRKAIPPKTKLQITLRYLATGDTFSSLQYLFRVPVNTISIIIPDVLHAMYNVLEPFIKVSTFFLRQSLICLGVGFA